VRNAIGKRTYAVLLVAAAVLSFLAVSPVAAHAEDPTRTLVCHYDKRGDFFTPITIPAHAVNEHIAKHGDVIPREDFGAGFVLDENCEELVAGCSFAGSVTVTTIHADGASAPRLTTDGIAVAECNALGEFYGIDLMPWAQVGFPVVSGSIRADDHCSFSLVDPACIPVPIREPWEQFAFRGAETHVLYISAETAGKSVWFFSGTTRASYLTSPGGPIDHLTFCVYPEDNVCP